MLSLSLRAGIRIKIRVKEISGFVVDLAALTDWRLLWPGSERYLLLFGGILACDFDKFSKYMTNITLK